MDRLWDARFSATNKKYGQHDERPGDHVERAQGRLDRVLEQQARYANGDGPESTIQASRESLSASGLRCARPRKKATVSRPMSFQK